SVPAVALVLRWPTVFCPTAPTVRTISTTTGPILRVPRGIVVVVVITVGQIHGWRGSRLTRTPPVLDIAWGYGRGGGE
ncbi:hypothetical protein EDB85DRAFT_2038318, partial [Lactarius pseudohatsudake]